MMTGANNPAPEPDATRLKTWVIDADPAGSQQVAALLGTLPAYQFLGESSTFETALKAIEIHPLDVVVIDTNLPEGRGYWLIEQLSKLTPAPRLVLHSHFFGPHSLWLALKHRIRACVAKHDPDEQLQMALVSVASGGVFYSISAAATFQSVRRNFLGAERNLDALESEVLLLQQLAASSGLKGAAHDLGLTYNRAYRRLRASMRRANLRSARELQRYLTCTGL